MKGNKKWDNKYKTEEIRKNRLKYYYYFKQIAKSSSIYVRVHTNLCKNTAKVPFPTNSPIKFHLQFSRHFLILKPIHTYIVTIYKHKNKTRINQIFYYIQ